MRSGFQNRILRAFTLVELLAATAVFMLILVMTLVFTSNMTRLTTESTSSLAGFQEARTAFETMNRTLSQAVLNTYLDYDDPSDPQHYLRASELHFVVGGADQLTGLSDTAGGAVFCQAPLSRASTAPFKSQPDLLNALGFYIRFSTSDDLPPFLDSTRQQTAGWRLWMFLQPTEQLKVYDLYNGNPQAPSAFGWFQGDLTDPVYNHVLGNNIVFLLIRAGYADASGEVQETYLYDSRGATATTSFPQNVKTHQLPAVLHVTVVAIDQRTADLLASQSGGAPYNLVPGGLFTDAVKYPDDLKDVQAHLDQRPIGNLPIHYRIFETAVHVTSAKWSR